MRKQNIVANFRSLAYRIVWQAVILTNCLYNVKSNMDFHVMHVRVECRSQSKSPKSDTVPWSATNRTINRSIDQMFDRHALWPKPNETLKINQHSPITWNGLGLWRPVPPRMRSSWPKKWKQNTIFSKTSLSLQPVQHRKGYRVLDF